MLLYALQYVVCILVSSLLNADQLVRSIMLAQMHHLTEEFGPALNFLGLWPRQSPLIKLLDLQHADHKLFVQVHKSLLEIVLWLTFLHGCHRGPLLITTTLARSPHVHIRSLLKAGRLMNSSRLGRRLLQR